LHVTGFLQLWRERATRRRTVVTDPKALYYGIAVNDQSLTPGANPRLGRIRFEEWLRQKK